MKQKQLDRALKIKEEIESLKQEINSMNNFKEKIDTNNYWLQLYGNGKAGLTSCYFDIEKWAPDFIKLFVQKINELGEKIKALQNEFDNL
jgi:FtsZ-binding cell division protein ZapB